MAQKTYEELRREKRAKHVFDDTRPNIHEPVNDRSPDNDPDDMRSQARSDLFRAQRAVKGPQEDLDYINKNKRELRQFELKEMRRLNQKYGRRKRSVKF